MANSHQRGVVNSDNIKEDKEGETVKGLTINTKALNIIWGGSNTKSRYWKQITEDGKDAVELVGVYWLEVSGRVPLSYLKPDTEYKLYFKIKMKPNALGWEKYPVYFKLRLPGTKSNQVSLKLSDVKNTANWQKLPRDGLPFKFSQSTSQSTQSSALTFAMYEIECEDFKSGLVVQEVIIEKVMP